MVRLVDNSAAAFAAAKRGALNGLTTIALLVTNDAKEYAPVLTGHHRRSIGYTIKEDGDTLIATIGHQSDYGLWLEMGTRHMAARPHFRPALDKNEAALAPAISAAVGAEIATTLPRSS